MRRGLVILAIGFALFVAATIGGFTWSARRAPGWARAELERQLTLALEAPVRLDSVRLRLRGGIRLVARDAKIGPTPAGFSLDAENLEGWLDPIALVMGRLELDRLVAERATLTVPGPDPDGPSFLATLRTQALALATGPIRRLIVVDTSLWVTSPDHPAQRVLAGLEGEVTRHRLRSGARFSLAARLGEGIGTGRLEGRAAPGTTRFTLTLDAIDLGELPGVIADLLPGWVHGTVRGEIDWHTRDGEPDRFQLDLTGQRIAGRIPGESSSSEHGGPRAFALARPALSVTLESSAESLVARDGVISDGGPKLRFHGRLGRPERDDARLELTAATSDLGVRDLRDLVERLPFPPAAAQLVSRLEAGRIDRLAIRLDTSVGGLATMWAQGPLARPGDIRIEVEVSEIRATLGEDDALEGAEGSLAFDGDRLTIRGLQGRRHGVPRPRIEAEITGLSNLHGLDELRCRRPAVSGRVPGVPALLTWLRSHRKEPKVPGWTELAVQADWVSHPELLCGIEQLDASLRPFEAGGGLDVEVRHAVWAGLAVSGRGRITDRNTRDPGSLTFQVALGSAFEPMALVPPTEPWAQGRFRWDAFRLGRWRVLGAAGGFRLSGERLHLEHVALDLAPSGVIDADVAVDLGHESRLLYEASLRGTDLDVTSFASAARARDPGRITGTLSGETSFEGQLVLGRTPLAFATGRMRLRARDGRLARDLPIVVALLMADSPFSPIGDLEEIRYDRFEADATLEKGWFSSDRMEIDGPSVRIVSAGRLSVERPHPIEGVLGVLFFPNLDSVIGQVPVLNRVILGQDGNLLGAYYGLSGPWSEPAARLIPVKSLVSGPASFVLEDIPSFLWGGLKRIQSILVPGVRDRARREPARVDS